MNAPMEAPGQNEGGSETIDRVTGTHYENLMRKLLVVVRGMPKTWKQLTEVQQDNVLIEFDNYVKEALRNAVRDMAGADFPAIPATLDQVVIKDGFKAVLKMGQAIPHRHELADAEGTTVILILADASEYIKGVRPRQSRRSRISSSAARSRMPLLMPRPKTGDSPRNTPKKSGNRATKPAPSLISKKSDSKSCPRKSRTGVWRQSWMLAPARWP